MKTAIPNSVTGTGNYKDYINKKDSPCSRFSFERYSSKTHLYGWNTDVPAWEIKFTNDGSNFINVGCITCFADGVKGSLDDGTSKLLDVAGTDPYTLFVDLTKQANKDLLIEKFEDGEIY